MICDEVGRGFAFLGSTYGLAIVAGIGIASYSEAGIIMALAASAGCLAMEITSIVDAVKVAKVNVHNRSGKKKVFRGRYGKTSNEKIAIVTLSEGKINFEGGI